MVKQFLRASSSPRFVHGVAAVKIDHLQVSPICIDQGDRYHLPNSSLALPQPHLCGVSFSPRY